MMPLNQRRRARGASPGHECPRSEHTVPSSCQPTKFTPQDGREEGQEEEGAADGQERLGQVVDAIHRLLQLRRQGHAAVGRDHRRRTQSCALPWEPDAQSVGLWRPRRFRRELPQHAGEPRVLQRRRPHLRLRHRVPRVRSRPRRVLGQRPRPRGPQPVRVGLLPHPQDGPRAGPLPRQDLQRARGAGQGALRRLRGCVLRHEHLGPVAVPGLVEHHLHPDPEPRRHRGASAAARRQPRGRGDCALRAHHLPRRHARHERRRRAQPVQGPVRAAQQHHQDVEAVAVEAHGPAALVPAVRRVRYQDDQVQHVHRQVHRQHLHPRRHRPRRGHLQLRRHQHQDRRPALRQDGGSRPRSSRSSSSYSCAYPIGQVLAESKAHAESSRRNKCRRPFRRQGDGIQRPRVLLEVEEIPIS